MSPNIGTCRANNSAEKPILDYVARSTGRASFRSWFIENVTIMSIVILMKVFVYTIST
jgi:hypothetical protein